MTSDAEQFNTAAMTFAIMSVYLHAGVEPGFLEEFFHYMSEKKKGQEMPPDLDKILEEIKELWKEFQNDRFDH